MVCVSKTLITYTLATMAAHAAQQPRRRHGPLELKMHHIVNNDFGDVFCSTGIDRLLFDSRDIDEPPSAANLKKVILTKIKHKEDYHIQVRGPKFKGRIAAASITHLVGSMPGEIDTNTGLTNYHFENISGNEGLINGIRLKLSDADYCKLKKFLGLKAKHQRSIGELEKYEKYLNQLIEQNWKDPATYKADLKKCAVDAFKMIQEQATAFKEMLSEIGEIAGKMDRYKLLQKHDLDEIMSGYVFEYLFHIPRILDDDSSSEDVATNFHNMLKQQRHLLESILNDINEGNIRPYQSYQVDEAFKTMKRQAHVFNIVMLGIRDLYKQRKWDEVKELVTTFLEKVDDRAFEKLLDLVESELSSRYQ